MRLRDSIERLVVDILASFGVAKRHYREEPLGTDTITNLDTFEITPFGKVLLDGIAILSDW